MSLETEHGKATVVMLCEVFGLSRSAYYEARVALKAHRVSEPTPSSSPSQRHAKPAQGAVPLEELREAIKTITDHHRAWGVRKVHAVLRRAPYELRASRKRVWAVMKAMRLCFAPGARPAEESRGTVAVSLPNRRWATDFTTVYTAEDGVVAVVPVIDCGCRTVLELRVTKSQESPSILAGVGAALCAAFGTPSAVPDGLELRTDHGPQYTGEDCRELCARWKVDHTFAPVGRPTGNAVAERVIRTMKEECIWLRDWRSVTELQEGLEEWRRVYNEQRPHQALDWKTPAEARASDRSEVLLAA